MKILVTGAAGYIGSVLVPMLLEKGHEVTALDNFMYKQDSLLGSCHYRNLAIIRGDARDRTLIEKLCRNIDYVFPLAAIVGAPACDRDPIASETTNVESIKAISETADDGVRIVFPNTNSGYGIGTKGLYCTEESPLNPISRYGRQKVEAERIVLTRSNSIVLRLATVFGTSQRMRLDLLVNDFVFRAVRDGYVILFEPHFKRNYIHVRDVAYAFIYCMDNFDRMKNQVYNLGLSEANLSKLELCQVIKEQVPNFYFCESPIGEDPDKRNYIVSNEKIEKAGFRPRYSLADGIAELINGYRVIRNDRFTNI